MTRLDPSFFDAPIAHRGLHDSGAGVIENSLSAVRAAAKAGYGIEIDLQPAADDTPMVFHDYLLERLTAEKGPVKSRTVGELEATALKGSEDTVPTLETVLAEVDGRVPMLIEIKDQDMRLGPDVGNFHDAVCEVLSRYGGPIALMSFSPDTIERVAALLPGTPLGLITDPFHAEDWPNVSAARRQELARLPDVARLNVDFISHQKKDLASPVVAHHKANGLPIFCWTIRSAEEESKARQVADNITFEGYTPARPSP